MYRFINYSYTLATKIGINFLDLPMLSTWTLDLSMGFELSSSAWYSFYTGSVTAKKEELQL